MAGVGDGGWSLHEDQASVPVPARGFPRRGGGSAARTTVMWAQETVTTEMPKTKHTAHQRNVTVNTRRHPEQLSSHFLLNQLKTNAILHSATGFQEAAVFTRSLVGSLNN